ncbi:MAG: DUF2442 domain-containing protein [bacterium]
MYKIVKLKVLSDYRIWIKYNDNTEGTLDLSNLVGKGIFSLWNDYEEFKKVTIGSIGELKWGDNIDLCPDSLYLQLTGKDPEEIFPNLKKESVHA